MQTLEQVQADPAYAGVDPREVADYYRIAEALTQRGHPVTVADVTGWSTGDFDGGDMAKMEAAVIAFMGKETFDQYDSLARTIPALMFHLGLITERLCGGIDLSLSRKGLTPDQPAYSILNRKPEGY